MEPCHPMAHVPWQGQPTLLPGGRKLPSEEGHRGVLEPPRGRGGNCCHAGPHLSESDSLGSEIGDGGDAPEELPQTVRSWSPQASLLLQVVFFHTRSVTKHFMRSWGWGRNTEGIPLSVLQMLGVLLKTRRESFPTL